MPMDAEGCNPARPPASAATPASSAASSPESPSRPAPGPGGVRDLPRLRALAAKLHRDGRLSEAITAYNAYLAERPRDAGIWSNLGVALRTQGHLQAAVLCYRRALELTPGDPDVCGNLGNVLKDLDQLDEAIAVQRTAVEARPDDVRLLFNLGLTFREADRFEEALAAIDRALALKPGDPSMRWDRALVLLHLGRYAEGWTDYQARWEIGEISRPRHRQPLWQGESLAGKTILLYPEQGFGDTILASRFLPRLKAQGAGVILECKPPLRRLFAGLAGVDRLVGLGDAPRGELPGDEPQGGFDCHCSLMDLPGLFGLEADGIPPPARLSVPEEARVRAKRLLAAAAGRFKVGVVWSGSVTYKGNRKRSASLRRFLELAAVPGVQLYSLYKGPLERELKESGAGPLLLDVGSQDADLADTAAVIEGLDLVVMTDSAVAHLAGSLGRPIWNLLCYSPYWLYGAAGETTPWYPSMRLIRQPAPGDWDAVFERVKDELAAAVAAKQAGDWPPQPG